MGVYFLDRGIMPLGTLMAGSMASLIGAPLTLGSMAIIGILLPLWVAISVPRIRSAMIPVMGVQASQLLRAMIHYNIKAVSSRFRILRKCLITNVTSLLPEEHEAWPE